MKPRWPLPDPDPYRPLHSLRYPTFRAQVWPRTYRGWQRGDRARGEEAATAGTSVALWRRALLNGVKTCGMQLWSREEHICTER